MGSQRVARVRSHSGARVGSQRGARAADGAGGGREAAVGLGAAGVGRVLEQAALRRQVGELGAPGGGQWTVDSQRHVMSYTEQTADRHSAGRLGNLAHLGVDGGQWRVNSRPCDVIHRKQTA